MPTAIERRVFAIEQTMAFWKERPFGMPRNDCLKMLLWECRQLGITLPNSSKMIGYKTPLQARAALKRVWGVKSMIELCDKFWHRVPVAAALPADPILLPGQDDELTLGAVGLYVGNNVIFCWTDDAPEGPVAARLLFEPDQPQPLTAWRLPV